MRRPLPKGDRGDFLVEKLTELGVTRFVPLRTRRSVVHPDKLDRLERAVIEASKQCGRNVLMEVAPLTDWEDYVGAARCRRCELLAHFGGERARRPAVRRRRRGGRAGGRVHGRREWRAAVAAGWQVVVAGAADAARRDGGAASLR